MWPIMRAMRRPRLGTVPALLFVEMPAMEVGVGDDGTARHLVEGDVLGGEVGRAGDHDGVAHTVRVLQRPGQRLHAAKRAAHDGGQRLDAQRVEQAGLGVDPVFHGDDRKVGAIDPTLPVAGFACIGPVEPKHEPRLLTPMTKKRSVSTGLPGPIMLSHQPSELA
jgi:hypothetical protein